MIRRRVVVHGLVQGVFFRDTVRRKALAAGVSGWVRNRPDGTVEAVLEDARYEGVAFTRLPVTATWAKPAGDAPFALELTSRPRAATPMIHALLGEDAEAAASMRFSSRSFELERLALAGSGVELTGKGSLEADGVLEQHVALGQTTDQQRPHVELEITGGRDDRHGRRQLGALAHLTRATFNVPFRRRDDGRRDRRVRGHDQILPRKMPIRYENRGVFPGGAAPRQHAA